MKSNLAPIIFILFSLFIKCDYITEEKNNDLIYNDSLKVFFYNLSKKNIDSLNSVISKDIMTKRGIDVEKLFLNIAKKDTLSYEFYAQYAYLLATKNQPRLALKYLKLGKSKVKDISRFYFDNALIWAYIEPLHKRDSMYKYLDFAIAKDSMNPYYYAVFSRFCNEDGDNIAALKNINKAIYLSKNDTAYLNQRGLYKVLLSDFEGAIVDMELISHSNLNNPDFYYYKSVSFHKLKKYNQAIPFAKKCILLNPNYSNAYTILGNALYNIGSQVEGIEYLKKAAYLGDKDAIDFMKKYEDYMMIHKKI